ncbi:MAG: type I secretion C-terminal target domain-containing protein [Caulobacteraceae bacterium]|nr:type I secretion C-terminal target domain-containing protein [Caulobacteraceae bacterium]
MLTFTDQPRQIADDEAAEPLVDVDVDVYVYAPDEPGEYPVIIYSHGTRGEADQTHDGITSSLPLYWVSQGYIVILPAHAEGRDATQSQIDNLPLEDEFDGAVNGFLFNRVEDMKTALDHIGDLLAELGPGYSSSGYVVAAGYSAGGSTAEVAAGVSIKDLYGNIVNWGDSRFDALIDLSAGGAMEDEEGHNPYGFYDDEDGTSWDGFSKPMFVATGENDVQKDGGNYQHKLDPYDNAPAGHSYAFVFNNARHGDFGVRVSETDPGDNFHVYVELTSLTGWFLDGYAKGQIADLASLRDVDGQMADDTTFTELWQALHTGTKAGDTLTGNGGANTLVGTDYNDTLSGLGGADTLTGGMGGDILSGGAGGDFLDGGSGRDTLTGGLGADTLVGGFDSDVLTGGAGTDTFRFVARGDGGGRGDTITDFAIGSDHIDVDALLTSIEQSTTSIGDHIDLVVVGVDTWIILDVDNDTDYVQGINTLDDEVIAVVLNTAAGGATLLSSGDFLF